jgi:hypothetical protein
VYWFKTKHPNLSITQAKGLEVSKEQGLTINSYKTFNDNLQILYTQNNYNANHV